MYFPWQWAQQEPSSRRGGVPPHAAPVADRASRFASLSSHAAPAAPAAQGSTTEPATGCTFPTSIEPRFTLAGLGVRRKKVVVKNVNVYTLGLYVDPSDVKSALQHHKGSSVDKLAAKQSFYDDFVADGSIDKTMRIVSWFPRMTKDRFVNALEAAVLPRLQQEGQQELLSDLNARFDGVSFQKGMEVIFNATPQGHLNIAVDGKKKAPIASPLLCECMFGVWLGQDTVAPEAKLSMGTGLAAMVL